MIQLFITAGQTTTDYSRFVDWTSLQITEKINLPTQMSFTLNPISLDFVLPPQRAYVQVYSSRYDRSLFTGYITSAPVRNFKGLAAVGTGGHLYTFQLSCVSDDYLLNSKAVPFIPAFVNRSEGQILADIAEVLCPGFFDTTSMVASGDIVPYFAYNPQQSWSELAKQFGDGSRYRYKVRDKQIWFQPYGDSALGITYDESQPQKTFLPSALKTTVLNVPIVNDITIIGATEAGNNREDYVIGDGFSADFPLLHKVFHGASTILLQESWNNLVLNLQNWFLLDPGVNFDFTAGALNLVDTLPTDFVLGDSYLAMNNGLELAGSLDLEHGEFTFNDYCDGVIGGVYSDATYVASGLLGGFVINSSGQSIGTNGPPVIIGGAATSIGASGVQIQPWWAGSGFVTSPSRTAIDGLFHSQLIALALINAFLGSDSASISQWNYLTLEINPLAQPLINQFQFTVDQLFTSAQYIQLRIDNGLWAGWSILVVDGASGTMIGDPVITQFNHNYVLQTVISAPQYVRYNRFYRTVEGEAFGGTDTVVIGNVTFIIQDFDIAAATGFFYTPNVFKYTVSNVILPPFATYALINNKKLNLTASNTTVALMPLGTLMALTGPNGLVFPTGAILPMLPPNSGWHDDITGFIGGVPGFAKSTLLASGAGSIKAPPLRLNMLPTQEVMGNGFELQAAQITQGNEADKLDFYAQTIPAAGTRIRFQSWEAQAAVSRLQDAVSISGEAFVVGDDGLRSAIVTDLNPLPRTSEDCDNAGLAFLKDRVGTFYNGTYQWCVGAPGFEFLGISSEQQFWPTCGRFFPVHAPFRGIERQKYLVTGLTIKIREAVQEIIDFSIQFGADLYLEKVLKNFVDTVPVNVLTPQDAANPPNPRFTQNVQTSFLPDLQNTSIDPLGINETSITVNVRDFYFGAIEVRRLDTNWGRGPTPDLIANVMGPVFTLARNQFDQQWFMRPVQGLISSGGITSRRSKVLRVRYPVKPSPPTFVGASQGLVQFNYNGDIRSVYGFELRTAPVPGVTGNDHGQVVLYQQPATSYADLNVDLFNGTPFGGLPQSSGNDWTLYAYFFNHMWGYSDPLVVQLTNIVPGPVIYGPALRNYGFFGATGVAVPPQTDPLSLVEFHHIVAYVDETTASELYGQIVAPIAASGDPLVITPIIASSGSLAFSDSTYGPGQGGDFIVFNNSAQDARHTQFRSYEIAQIMKIGVSGDYHLRRQYPGATGDFATFNSYKCAHPTGTRFYKVQLQHFPHKIQTNTFQTLAASGGLAPEYWEPWPNACVVAQIAALANSNGFGPWVVNNCAQLAYPFLGAVPAQLPPAPGMRTLTGAAYGLTLAGVPTVGQHADFKVRIQDSHAVRCAYAMFSGALGVSGSTTINVLYIEPLQLGQTEASRRVALIDTVVIPSGSGSSYDPTVNPAEARRMPYNHEWPTTDLAIVSSSGTLILQQDGDIDFQVGGICTTPGSTLAVWLQT